MSVRSSEARCDGRQTDRLERRDAVNLCLARPAAAPDPLMPVPPSIVKFGGEAIAGTGDWRGSGLFNSCPRRRCTFCAKSFSAGRPETAHAEPPGYDRPY